GTAAHAFPADPVAPYYEVSSMSHLRHALTSGAALTTVAAALFFLPARPATAVPPADPVEELRQALPFQIGDEKNEAALDYRRDTLEKRVNALKTLSDLRRALSLTEWKDMLGSPARIRQIDSAARKKVGD